MQCPLGEKIFHLFSWFNSILCSSNLFHSNGLFRGTNTAFIKKKALLRSEQKASHRAEHAFTVRRAQGHLETATVTFPDSKIPSHTVVSAISEMVDCSPTVHIVCSFAKTNKQTKQLYIEKTCRFYYILYLRNKAFTIWANKTPPSSCCMQ